MWEMRLVLVPKCGDCGWLAVVYIRLLHGDIDDKYGFQLSCRCCL